MLKRWGGQLNHSKPNNIPEPKEEAELDLPIFKEYPHLKTGKKEKKLLDDSKNGYYVIISSVGLENIHKAMKYELWSSPMELSLTLNSIWIKAKDFGKDDPIFLIFRDENRYVGVALMTSNIQPDEYFAYWDIPDRWFGTYKLKWLIIKDIPPKIIINECLKEFKEWSENMESQTGEDFIEEFTPGKLLKSKIGQQILRTFYDWKGNCSDIIQMEFKEFDDKEEKMRNKLENDNSGSYKTKLKMQQFKDEFIKRQLEYENLDEKEEGEADKNKNRKKKPFKKYQNYERYNNDRKYIGPTSSNTNYTRSDNFNRWNPQNNNNYSQKYRFEDRARGSEGFEGRRYENNGFFSGRPQFSEGKGEYSGTSFKNKFHTIYNKAPYRKPEFVRADRNFQGFGGDKFDQNPRNQGDRQTGDRHGGWSYNSNPNYQGFKKKF